jgi:hypothetical protein
LPDDEKEIDFFADGEPLRSEPRGFAPEQMVTCEACLRANPPTRTSCLYCGAQLPATEVNAALQKPTLRRLEKWEEGFNTILLPGGSAQLTQETLEQAADLLQLKPEELQRIVEAGVPLPIARAASHNEAALIENKLSEMGLSVLIISDSDLLPNESMMRRVRTLEFTEDGFVAFASGGSETWRAAWNEVALLVAGRLFVRQIEIEERKGRRAENELVDARELSADESVLDIYTTQNNSGWRITANNFDFSCLGAQKGLIAAQNFSTLTKILRERADASHYDDSYNAVRHALSTVWPLEQQTESHGWRRARIGRVNTEAVTRSDNETQFTRYSRLRYYLRSRHPELKA